MSGELDQKIAQFLKQRRGSETFASFARKLGISNSTLHRIENGRQSITFRNFEQILDRLNCGYQDVFGPNKPSPVLREFSKAESSRPIQSAKYPKKKRKPS